MIRRVVFALPFCFTRSLFGIPYAPPGLPLDDWLGAIRRWSGDKHFHILTLYYCSLSISDSSPGEREESWTFWLVKTFYILLTILSCTGVE